MIRRMFLISTIKECISFGAAYKILSFSRPFIVVPAAPRTATRLAENESGSIFKLVRTQSCLLSAANDSIDEVFTGSYMIRFTQNYFKGLFATRFCDLPHSTMCLIRLKLR